MTYDQDKISLVRHKIAMVIYINQYSDASQITEDDYIKVSEVTDIPVTDVKNIHDIILNTGPVQKVTQVDPLMDGGNHDPVSGVSRNTLPPVRPDNLELT